MISQKTENVTIAIENGSESTIQIEIPDNNISNPDAIAGFFANLKNLENSKTSQINIVHIGDSHIQADMMTDRIRKLFQNKFGNSGRGFVIPHCFGNNNGNNNIMFSSNANWSDYRNIFPPNGSIIGLSGIALSTKFVSFVIELVIKDENYFFKKLKIITPNNENGFGLAVSKKIVSEAILVPKKIFHKIQKREKLSAIADKFQVTIAALKSFNNLKSEKIKRGKTLKIPTDEKVVKKAEHSEYISLETELINGNVVYESAIPLEKIFLIASKKLDEYNLNGIILENNKAGILYHNIGVNGAKFLDYNKYPLFFAQLKSLSPDLFIVSLGTNESFGKFSTEKYSQDMDVFLENLQQKHPNASILLTTLTPSLFQKKFPNLVVADYAAKTIAVAETKNISVMDLHAQMGGVFGVEKNYSDGIIDHDRIHYSKIGYEKQGELLFEAIIKAYLQFKN